MKPLIALLFALALQGANAQAPAHAVVPSMKEVTDVARQSLATLAQIVSEGNYRSLGFESADEARSARAETPLPVYLVKLDALKGYARGGDPKALLTPLDKAIVPLSVSGDVRSSVTIESRDGRWVAEGFGAPRLARALAQARRAASSSAQGASFFVVQVAALGSYFLGHVEGGRLMLTTIIDEPNLKASAFRTLSADDVFAALAPLAQQHNGLPM